ncbi:MAG: hydrogenase [Deltaproteobacteria bacterium]|nr:hydrogenase [Deltaproteobacteria bacterium]
MLSWLEALIILLVLTNFALLGSSRLASLIRLVALQGMLLGIITIASQPGAASARIYILALGNIATKCLLFPWLFYRAVKEVNIRREVEPYVGYNLSLLAGVISFGLSLWLGDRLPFPTKAFSDLAVPTVFFMLWVGLLLIISRNKAITQVVGYLVMENGIYLFGISFVEAAPLFVELGVLLDVIVGVFIMGIIIHQIDRQFDTLHVGQLANLKD